MEDPFDLANLTCPVPLTQHERIVLGHGSGGRMSHDLIARYFLPHFANPALLAGNDAAVVSPFPGSGMAISTDAHVVSPLFFPGGDIGRLAVCGTVNDVAMLGAIPHYVTAGFILEEGLELAILQRIIDSMQAAAAEAEVMIVAGDTKVVQRGKADGVYITTTGVGQVISGVQVGGGQAQPGDAVLLSGPIGDHGIAVLAARGELGFDAKIQSDVAPLNHMVAALLDVCQQVHVLRDPTRGGLATTLNEIASQSQVGIEINENSLPIRPAVAAACELLGFDPLYVANEGKLVAIVAQEEAKAALGTLQASRYGEQAVQIGTVMDAPKGRVLMQTGLGTTRIVDMLASEMLPRIC